MLGFLALALAADAESRASNANNTANQALDEAARSGHLDSAFVSITDFELKTVQERESKGFWDRLIIGNKKVLDDKPKGVYSIRRSDITRIQQYKDDDDKPFVCLFLAKYARFGIGNNMVKVGFYVPGTIAEANAILNGVK